MLIVWTAAQPMYLAATTFPAGTGEVSSSWSVRLRRSSASVRIVRTGTVISPSSNTDPSELAMYGSP